MPPDVLPYVFGGLMLVGVLYFVYSIFFGDVGEGGLEVASLDDVGEIGCSVIAAFLAGFGAVGLLGVWSGWGLLVTLGVAAVFGLVIGRVIMWVLRLIARQQSTDVTNVQNLIGSSARVTIDIPAGKVGEAIIEEGYVAKYPIREVGDHALQRGDHVEVVDVQNGMLHVKKKRSL